ncbi:hypothetical protein [Ottowia massiliensis]|uniref:hypothetical protein n=1 Tax=Ottowia massiliensis TaxID=2045302 RepID=UPI0018EBAB94|nr:hypothetical protein [Ottowia massiliensis]
MSIQNLIKEGIDLFKNKKFDEAITKLSQALEKIENKDSHIQEQNDIQFWLGRCYFEQAIKAKGEASTRLFEQAIEHHQQQLRLAKQLEGENGIQEQIYAQSWLGNCYLEQARRAKGEDANQLFGQADECFKKQLELAERLTDKQNSLQEQIYAQHWLGNCYLEQARRAKGEDANQLFGQAGECFKKQLELAERLTDKQNSLQEQIYAQHWLGRYYFKRAKKAKGEDANQLFGQASGCFKQKLELAELLEGKNGIWEQINTKWCLGYCDYAKAIAIENNNNNDKNCFKDLSRSAARWFLCALRQMKQLDDDELRKKKIQRKIYHYLKKIYFLEATWVRYFKWKKQEIQENLFEKQKSDLTNAISIILAVLNIPPIELGSIPLAHYTSPSVCEKLFGIVHDKNDVNNKDKDPVDKQQASPMRISSSTYMNDPTEGEGLLELLNLQDLELKNKINCPDYNAFFTCFSSRVNDLNQFRLYGKENDVEASGCCLVFNKDGDWLKESDISFSFRSMAEKGDEYSREQPVEADISDADLEDANLPLYQVAYIAYQDIAYQDEYLAEDKCSIWLPKNKQKFGIQLEPVGKNPGWHQLRINKLEEALMKLMEKSNEINKEDRKALEYIRYLFKDFAFRDEEEFRLLKIEKIGSDKIEYCETTQSIYLPYADARDIVDEVILGTNYEKSGKGRKAEAFQHLMRKHYPNIKVSRSSLPINANPPIKKD